MVLSELIKQLAQYLQNMLLEGVDISALYIVEAHLTAIKNSVDPSKLMISLFSKLQLKKMCTFSKDYFENLKDQSEVKKRERQSYDEKTNKSTINLREYQNSCTREISVVSSHILQKLGDWNNIALKSEHMKIKLRLLTDYSCYSYSEDNLREELDTFIGLIDVKKIDRESIRFSESTECKSSSEDSEASLSNKKLKIPQIAAFFNHILIWSTDILLQIDSFSNLIMAMKEESSVDLEFEGEHQLLQNFRGSVHNLRQKIDRANFKHFTLEKNAERRGNGYNGFQKIEQVSQRQSRNLKDQFLSRKLNKISTQIGSKKHKNKQKTASIREKSCNRCQIY